MEEQERTDLPSTGDDHEPDTSKIATNKRKQAEWFDITDEHTYVYISGLPPSMTEDEFLSLMGKFGLIAKKTVQGNPYNIKLYKNKDGTFKGDALCRFVKKESVELALTYFLDGYRYDDKHTIYCERAKFEQKGSYDPSKKPRIDPKTKERQKKAVEKLLSWEPKMPPEVKQKKVILKHMFTPEQITADPSEILFLREEVEEECTKLIAEPKRVDVYDKHPDGVIAVTFSEPHQARACIEAFDKRYYDGKTISAELWDGKTKYKIEETDEESEARLEKWKLDIQESDGHSNEKEVNETK